MNPPKKKRYSKLDKAWSLSDSYNVARAADLVVNEIQQGGFISTRVTSYV